MAFLPFLSGHFKAVFIYYYHTEILSILDFYVGLVYVEFKCLITLIQWGKPVLSVTLYFLLIAAKAPICSVIMAWWSTRG